MSEIKKCIFCGNKADWDNLGGICNDCYSKIETQNAIARIRADERTKVFRELEELLNENGYGHDGNLGDIIDRLKLDEPKETIFTVRDIGIGFKIEVTISGLKLASYKTFETENEALGYIEFLKY